MHESIPGFGFYPSGGDLPEISQIVSGIDPFGQTPIVQRSDRPQPHVPIMFDENGAPVSERFAVSPLAGSVDVTQPFDAQGLAGRGGLENAHPGAEMVRLRNLNRPMPTDVALWETQPYLAAADLDPYLRNGQNDVQMDALKRWNMAYQVGGEQGARQWEESNPEFAASLREQVQVRREAIQSKQDVVRNTKLHLETIRQEKSTTWVEKLVNGTKEYVVDDFGKHPAMSAALVVGGIMVVNFLRQRKLGGYLALAAGSAVGYHFLRDKFGIRISDAAGIISPEAKKGVQTFLDTIRRPFVGPEGEGSALGYYVDKLGITSDNERTMLVALLQENPKTFFEWYNYASSGGAALPSGVQATLRRMQTSSSFKGLSNTEKTKVLLDVSNKMFDYIGKNSDGHRQNPKGYIINKYVTGDEFDTLYGHQIVEFKQKLSDPHTTKEQRDFCTRMIDYLTTQGKAMEVQVRNGSDAMTFLDVMLAEEKDYEALLNYDGAGKSLQELLKDFGSVANKTADVALTALNDTTEFLQDKGKKFVDFLDDKTPFVRWATSFKDAIVSSPETAKTLALEFAASPIGKMFESLYNLSIAELAQTGAGLEKLAGYVNDAADYVAVKAQKQELLNELQLEGISREDFEAWRLEFIKLHKAAPVGDVLTFSGNPKTNRILKKLNEKGIITIFIETTPPSIGEKERRQIEAWLKRLGEFEVPSSPSEPGSSPSSTPTEAPRRPLDTADSSVPVDGRRRPLDAADPTIPRDEARRPRDASDPTTPVSGERTPRDAADPTAPADGSRRPREASDSATPVSGERNPRDAGDPATPVSGERTPVEGLETVGPNPGQPRIPNNGLNPEIPRSGSGRNPREAFDPEDPFPSSRVPTDGGIDPTVPGSGSRTPLEAFDPNNPNNNGSRTPNNGGLPGQPGSGSRTPLEAFDPNNPTNTGSRTPNNGGVPGQPDSGGRTPLEAFDPANPNDRNNLPGIANDPNNPNGITRLPGNAFEANNPNGVSRLPSNAFDPSNPNGVARLPANAFEASNPNGVSRLPAEAFDPSNPNGIARLPGNAFEPSNLNGVGRLPANAFDSSNPNGVGRVPGNGPAPAFPAERTAPRDPLPAEREPPRDPFPAERDPPPADPFPAER